MKSTFTGIAIGVALAGVAYGQSAPPVAVDNPDKVSWELFVIANRPAIPGSNIVAFETWASNEDTFQPNPKFPGATAQPSCTPPQVAERSIAPVRQSPVRAVASPKILHVPALFDQEVSAQPETGVRAVTSAPVTSKEEVRRNQATFDFIVCNKLFTKAGLRAAFQAGLPMKFPLDSIEVKANWISAGNRSPNSYLISTASDGKRYALISMHVISKRVPNWTWATFEHQDNPGRCDIIGCHDSFGATAQDVPPNARPEGPYNPCVKSAAAKQLLADAGMPPVWNNYCLKGTQVDYVSATGAPTLVGNSVTEDGFVDSSSCMTCHVRAAIDATARNLYGAGFVKASDGAVCPNGKRSCGPVGAPNPAWFWNNPDQPNRSMLALQTDFVWSLARNAIGP